MGMQVLKTRKGVLTVIPDQKMDPEVVYHYSNTSEVLTHNDLPLRKMSGPLSWVITVQSTSNMWIVWCVLSQLHQLHCTLFDLYCFRSGVDISCLSHYILQSDLVWMRLSLTSFPTRVTLLHQASTLCKVNIHLTCHVRFCGLQWSYLTFNL